MVLFCGTSAATAFNNVSTNVTTSEPACESGFNGEGCEMCSEDVYGEDCGHQCDESRDCSDNGRCRVEGNCECFEGWYGEHCDSVCPGGFNGEGCEMCSGEVYGEDCEHQCDESRDCNDNGRCKGADEWCECFEGWHGFDCSVPGGECRGVAATVMLIGFPSDDTFTFLAFRDAVSLSLGGVVDSQDVLSASHCLADTSDVTRRSLSSGSNLTFDFLVQNPPDVSLAELHGALLSTGWLSKLEDAVLNVTTHSVRANWALHPFILGSHAAVSSSPSLSPSPSPTQAPSSSTTQLPTTSSSTTTTPAPTTSSSTTQLPTTSSSESSTTSLPTTSSTTTTPPPTTSSSSLAATTTQPPTTSTISTEQNLTGVDCCDCEGPSCNGQGTCDITPTPNDCEVDCRAYCADPSPTSSTPAPAPTTTRLPSTPAPEPPTTPLSTTSSPTLQPETTPATSAGKTTADSEPSTTSAIGVSLEVTTTAIEVSPELTTPSATPAASSAPETTPAPLQVAEPLLSTSEIPKADGTFGGFVSVTIWGTADYVNYTTDATSPTCRSSQQTEPKIVVFLSTSTTISAVACSLSAASDVRAVTYVVTRAPSVRMTFTIGGNLPSTRLPSETLDNIKTAVASALGIDSRRVRVISAGGRQRRLLAEEITVEILSTSMNDATALKEAVGKVDLPKTISAVESLESSTVSSVVVDVTNPDPDPTVSSTPPEDIGPASNIGSDIPKWVPIVVPIVCALCAIAGLALWMRRRGRGPGTPKRSHSSPGSSGLIIPASDGTVSSRHGGEESGSGRSGSPPDGVPVLSDEVFLQVAAPGEEVTEIMSGGLMRSSLRMPAAVDGNMSFMSDSSDQSAMACSRRLIGGVEESPQKKFNRHIASNVIDERLMGENPSPGVAVERQVSSSHSDAGGGNFNQVGRTFVREIGLTRIIAELGTSFHQAPSPAEAISTTIAAPKSPGRLASTGSPLRGSRPSPLRGPANSPLRMPSFGISAAAGTSVVVSDVSGQPAVPTKGRQRRGSYVDTDPSYQQHERRRRSSVVQAMPFWATTSDGNVATSAPPADSTSDDTPDREVVAPDAGTTNNEPPKDGEDASGPRRNLIQYRRKSYVDTDPSYQQHERRRRSSVVHAVEFWAAAPSAPTPQVQPSSLLLQPSVLPPMESAISWWAMEEGTRRASTGHDV